MAINLTEAWRTNGERRLANDWTPAESGIHFVLLSDWRQPVGEFDHR
jgi:hypothetical protein